MACASKPCTKEIQGEGSNEAAVVSYLQRGETCHNTLVLSSFVVRAWVSGVCDAFTNVAFACVELSSLIS